MRNRVSSYFVWWYVALLLGLTAALTWRTSISEGFASRPAARAIVKGDSFPKTVYDAYGYRIELPEPPRRIVSGMLASDEILLELLPKDRITAVTPFAFDPGNSNCHAKAAGLAALPGLKVERIVALQPDLVIASRLSDGRIVGQLRQCGVPVFCFGRFDSLAEIRVNVLVLGRVVGAQARAEKIACWMDDVLDSVRSRVASAASRTRVLYYDGGFTAGRDTILDQLVQLAGGVNVAAEANIAGHKGISEEMIVALNAEVIILPQPFGEKPILNSAKREPQRLQGPLWRTCAAVQKGQVWVLPRQHLGSISHHVVKAAVDVAKALHPHRFREPVDLRMPLKQ